MAFNIEYGSLFSRILSQEKLTIEISDTADTAYINLKDRKLVLPNWQGTQVLQRFLMTHEVAHAIFTPPEEWIGAIEAQPEAEQAKFQDCLNIVEDARIDRLMQERHPGTRSWYFKGTKELVSPEIWNVGSYDIPAMHLADRVNIHFKTKILNTYSVPFDSMEQDLVDRIAVVTSFADVIVLAHELMEKDPSELKPSNGIGQFEVRKGSPVETTEDLVEILADMVSNPPNLSGTITVRDDDYKDTIRRLYNDFSDNMTHASLVPRPVVNYMASAFERRKNARNFALTRIHDTGELDVSRLSEYRFTNDLFLRKGIVRKSKNHGFIMIVDMSYSMEKVFPNVIQHLHLLAQFCKRLSIPFVSYGFTSKGTDFRCQITNTKFALRPLLASTMGQKEIEETAKRLMSFSSFGSTPLTSAIHYTKTLALDFRANFGVDVLNIVFLTDGACTSSLFGTHYVDEVSHTMVEAIENRDGRKDATGALYSILRQRANANVMSFFIDSSVTGIRHETGIYGVSDFFAINPNILHTSHKVFIDTLMKSIIE